MCVYVPLYVGIDESNVFGVQKYDQKKNWRDQERERERESYRVQTRLRFSDCAFFLKS